MTNLLDLTANNLDIGQILTKSAEITADHVVGAALGGFLFSIPGAVIGTKNAINALDLNKEPKSPSEGLEQLFKIIILVPVMIPIGACMGATIAAAPGAVIGGALGEERTINLLKTPFNGIIGAVSYLASPAKSLASSAISTAYSGVTSHPMAVGVASTAVITGAMAYNLYNNYAQETKYSSKVSNAPLKEQEKILDDDFRTLQNALSTKLSKNKDLSKANDKLLNEYHKKKEINLETVLELQEAYKKAIKHLPKDKLEEISKLSIKLLEDIGKCQELRKNNTLEQKSSFADREKNKANNNQKKQR